MFSGSSRDLLVRGADAQGNVLQIDTPGGSVYVTQPIASNTGPGTTRYVVGRCLAVRAFLALHPIGMEYCFSVEPS